MHITTSCFSCFVVLATTLSPLRSSTPPASLASPAPPSPTPARIHVDATEIGTLSPAALDEIAAQATTEAAKHGLAPDQLRISLVVIDHLDVIRGVRVSIVTPSLTLADSDPRGPLVAECQACAEAELKTVAIEGLLEALSRYEQQRAAAEAAAAAQAEAAQAEATPPPPSCPVPADPAPRRSLHPLGWAGLTTLGLGTSAAIVGVAFVGLGDGRPPALLPLAQDHVRNYSTPGYALLGIGSAVAIAGAVMLAIDRRRIRASTLSLTPEASPTSVALQLHARF